MSNCKEMKPIDIIATKKRLGEAIAYRGYSQRDIAGLTNYTPQFISQWLSLEEKHLQKFPNTYAIDVLLQILGCKYEDLVVREGELKCTIAACLKQRDLEKVTDDEMYGASLKLHTDKLFSYEWVAA